MNEMMEFINEIIEDENGVKSRVQDPVEKCDLDSFGFTVLALEIQDKYGVDIIELIKSEEFQEMTFADLIDYIKNNDVSA